MRELTDQEKRTIRLGSVVLVVGLVLAGALWSARRLEAHRASYRKVMQEATALRAEMDRYRDKADLAQKLIDTYRLDPMTLARTSLVAQASAAIQKASGEAGVGLGPIRESTPHGSGKEIASIQIEGTGQIPSVMAFLYKLERTGSPLIIDSLRLTPDSHRPDMLKVNLTIVVVDFDQWKTEEKPNA
jgi:hypothetical protein